MRSLLASGGQDKNIQIGEGIPAFELLEKLIDVVNDIALERFVLVAHVCCAATQQERLCGMNEGSRLSLR
jgi:hypothetical protein